jgi:hypothetical protein
LEENLAAATQIFGRVLDRSPIRRAPVRELDHGYGVAGRVPFDEELPRRNRVSGPRRVGDVPRHRLARKDDGEAVFTVDVERRVLCEY